MKQKIKFSIIIPVFNEQENVKPLAKELKTNLEKISGKSEIIFVDDGSTDQTLKNLKKIKNIKIICLRKNYGQSTALDAGIKNARGDLIITIDGDQQNDPQDIIKLLKQLQQGYDFVCGWRYNRKDSLSRKIISKGASFLRKFLVNDKIHDSGCTLRIYKKECFQDVDIYGELHRMIPAILRWKGFTISEVKVNHRPRKHGKSKYNWKRIFKGFLDMIHVWFWRKYSHRPLHLFGGIGLLFNFIGGGLLVFLAFIKLKFGYPLANKIWPLVGFVFILIGIQLVATGLLAANLSDLQKHKRYSIKEIIE